MRLPLGLLPIVAAARKPSVLVLLGDDIGWGDVSYNGGAALTRHIDAWAAAPGSITFQDAHGGGTVCSPTRATILTGRNHFRDCVDYVYDCSDPTECDPGFPFAQTGTFTIADAARAAGHRSFFAGKWHLGSFYADAPYPSSPLVHGFDRMHATLEVAPTATTNCMCSAAWNASCEFGHDGGPEHCTGGFAAGGPDGCCFNYWFEDARSEHGVGNMTRPSHAIDAVEVQQSLSAFLKTVDDDAGFVAQLSFHNCHIPFVGAAATVAACRDGDGCLPENRQGQPKTNYSAAQLDFYACLLELDAAVGAVLRDLRDFKRYDDTLVYFTTDNGPEGDGPRGTRIFSPTSTVSTRALMLRSENSTRALDPSKNRPNRLLTPKPVVDVHSGNCGPTGFCDADHFATWPGDAAQLRGRKRDLFEGGHRVPTVASWPAVVGDVNRVSWATVGTTDLLPTVLDVLGVSRPEAQADWPLDGRSLAPLFRGAADWPAPRATALAFHDWPPNSGRGYAYRVGSVKLVVGSTSCDDCPLPMLFDLADDLEEQHDLAARYPDLVDELQANFSAWAESVTRSRAVESECPAGAPYSNGLPAVHLGWAGA